MATALLLQGLVQLNNGWVAVERLGRHWLLAPQQDPYLIVIRQVLRSSGFSVQRLQQRLRALVMRVGHQHCQLLPSPKALWTLQNQQRSGNQQVFIRIWLGFDPFKAHRRWQLDPEGFAARRPLKWEHA